MRSVTASLMSVLLGACSLPTGVSFKCEPDGGCPSGLRCVALDAGQYCLDADGGAVGGGTAAGGTAGGGTAGGATAGGGTAGGATAGGATAGGATAGGATAGGGTAGGGTAGGGTAGGGTAGGGTAGGGTAGGGTAGGGTAGGGTAGGGTAGGGTAGGGTAACGVPLDPVDTLYVSADGGSDSFTGISGVAPFATITHALTRSISLRRTVIAIAPGVYAEPVVLVTAHAGRVLTGGFLTDWSSDCAADARDRTVIDGPGIGLSLTNVSGTEVTVRRLTVRSGAPAMKGGSTYGVRALASNVALDDVAVIAEPASAGTTPASPADAIGTAACLGLSDCSDGGIGPRGAVGRPSDGGWFDATGFLPGVGISGSNGGAGFNGTPPPMPVPGSCATCSGSTPCNLGNLFCGNTTGPMSGSRGRCGCGGVAGLGAPGGVGGGASIAVFASGGSVVRVTNSLVRARAGGAGADGADGGLGSPGSPGTRGNPAVCIDPNGAMCTRLLCTDNCEPRGQLQNIPGGADGGTGGSGGTGGTGGPGAGGPSIGVVSISSTVTLTASTVNAGNAGQAVPGGQPGFSQQTLTIP